MVQKSSSQLKVAIIGATGYGGLQSIRILKDHPNFKITYLGGDRSSGRYWNELCPFLTLDENLLINEPDAKEIVKKADFVLLCLPNGFASQLVPELLSNGLRVIDLSADYRYSSLTQWKQIYSVESTRFNRTDHDLCAEAIYGLPEWNSELIAKARLVSAPGCFPTASLLPLLPFLKQGLIELDGLVIDAKSGTSGGGRHPKENLLLAEASESIAPYSVIGHRHTSEIEQIATLVSGQQVQVQFTPHLVPMVRGILSTVYARLRDPGLTAEDCKTVLEAIYRDKKSVQVLPVGTYPQTKWSRYTNCSILSVQVDKRNGQLILMNAIDNLIKGQAGQAIQSMNIMAGFKDYLGLPLTPFYP
tara:strand:+ start:95 stop:1174 length:1080 start_codon:yes stop_codon:yes gene_type:complete